MEGRVRGKEGGGKSEGKGGGGKSEGEGRWREE